jgi:hypothetical protein
MVEVIHGSCCSRATSRRPPLILAIFSIRVGYGKAFFVVRVEPIVGIVLQLVGIQIVILVIFVLVLISQVVGVVQIILIFFLKSFFVDFLAELADDVLLLKCVTDCQPRTPTCGFLNPLLRLIIAGGKFMKASAFATRVGSIRKFAN